MSVCSCKRLTLAGEDGREVETIADLDTRCPHHGFPKDEWTQDAPLRKLAIEVVEEAVYLEGTCNEFRRDERRLERPSETYARLLEEAS